MKPLAPHTAPAPPPTPRRPRPPADEACELCTRTLPLSFHHLIPRRLHDRRWFRDRFGIVEMRSRGSWVCRSCHDFIHEHFDENQLGRQLNTLDALKAEQLVQTHLAWAMRQRVAKRR